MVSWHMVLFGITHLRLDIFITWWMSIFQGTVVWRHFASLSVHHHILGHTPSPRALDLPQVSFTFWSNCWLPWVAYWGIPSFSEIIGPFTCFIIFWSSCRPRELHTRAYPPSPRSSDLSQASLSFDLVVDPYELSYWGISHFLRDHQTFHRFHLLFDLVVDSLELHTRAYPPSLGSSDLSWA